MKDKEKYEKIITGTLSSENLRLLNLKQKYEHYKKILLRYAFKNVCDKLITYEETQENLYSKTNERIKESNVSSSKEWELKLNLVAQGTPLSEIGDVSEGVRLYEKLVKASEELIDKTISSEQAEEIIEKCIWTQTFLHMEKKWYSELGEKINLVCEEEFNTVTEQFKEETSKYAVWGGRLTNGFKKWLRNNDYSVERFEELVN